jgi:hypothetical protein
VIEPLGVRGRGRFRLVSLVAVLHRRGLFVATCDLARRHTSIYRMGDAVTETPADWHHAVTEMDSDWHQAVTARHSDRHHAVLRR